MVLSDVGSVMRRDQVMGLFRSKDNTVLDEF